MTDHVGEFSKSYENPEGSMITRRISAAGLLAALILFSPFVARSGEVSYQDWAGPSSVPIWAIMLFDQASGACWTHRSVDVERHVRERLINGGYVVEQQTPDRVGFIFAVRVSARRSVDGNCYGSIRVSVSTPLMPDGEMIGILSIGEASGVFHDPNNGNDLIIHVIDEMIDEMARRR